jgi:cell division protein FtsB
MILLGLVLMAACAALAVDAVIQNHHAIAATAFNQPISHLSLGALFVAGTVVGLLFALGLLMFTGGIGRAGRKRRERKLAAREAQAETEALREHNDRLAAQLDRERTTTPYPADTADTAAGLSADNDERLSGRHRA